MGGLISAVTTPFPVPSGTGQRMTVLPREEIRFGVVLNGGVSLAVWMGGAVLELDRLVRSGPQAADPAGPPRAEDPVYGALLALAGCTARADVISGTSAGGINGAALALSQVNDRAQLRNLRDLWVEQGRIDQLLRQPFQGAPTSLLKGDDFFLPALNQALVGLTAPLAWRATEQAPVDLTITTTVLRGNQLVTVDSLGQQLPQTLHAARFRWNRDARGREVGDPFAPADLATTAARMALAARATASFPVAFEPVFVPVRGADAARRPGAGAGEQLRPDMTGVVDQWGDETTRDRSRYAVDGGLLANTPTREALESVEAMAATGPVRRVMLLVYPHAEPPGVPVADSAAEPPSVMSTISGLLGALTAQGSRTYVDQLEEHNRIAAGRRGTRADILEETPDPADLEVLTRNLYTQYARLRRWRAGRDLARRVTHRPVSAAVHADASVLRWNYEQVRRAAERAQERWADEGLPSPYVPRLPPSADTVHLADPWGWGAVTARGLAEAANDLMRRLLWLLPPGDDYDAVTTARGVVSQAALAISAQQRRTDDFWAEDPALARLTPNEPYWGLRLAAYQRLTVGEDPRVELRERITRVAVTAGRAPDAPPGREDAVRAALEAHIVHEVPDGDVGRAVAGHVAEVVGAVVDVLAILYAYCEASSSSSAAKPHREAAHALDHWRRLLVPDGQVPSPDIVLARLLQLEVVATTVGDEASTGASLPVEVAQLSAQTTNLFATFSRTGDDKLGGMSVNRFGGFLKRSWRANDWIWGRADAATVLCRIVLQPQRVRRAALVTGYLEGRTVDEAVEDTLEEIRALLFGGEDVPEELFDAWEQARRELTLAFALEGRATENLEPTMPGLADVFAWALHADLVAAELPALARAIAADRVDGANARSRGEVLLAEHQRFLDSLAEAARRQEQPDLAARRHALAVFDRAGVGREPLTDEASSDLMVRTATTAAAVSATVLDSPQFGVGFTRPVTRVVRGGMLLPFWTVTGLTSRAVLARSLALLGLAIGAVLLALSLFGALPGSLAGPAAAVGGSAVLVAFAYGALRSGTVLHGLVLLTPVVPLLAYAFDQSPEAADGAEGTSAASASRGVSTLLVVAALALGLMVLGSLPGTTGSVWSALDRLAERRGVSRDIPVDRETGWRAGLQRGWWRVLGVLLTLLRMAPTLAAVAALVLGAWWVGAHDVTQWVATLRGNPWPAALAAVMAVVAGGVLAYTFGRQLQVLRQEAVAEGQPTWRYQPLLHAAGTAPGWAVLYGGGYFLLAAGLLWRSDALDRVWAQALLVTAVVLGFGLCLVVPVWLPLRAVATVRRREAARVVQGVGGLGRGGPAGDGGPRGDIDPVVADLVARGVAYRCLVEVADDGRPVLRSRMTERIAAERQRVRS